jgi:hypothetical protein
VIASMVRAALLMAAALTALPAWSQPPQISPAPETLGDPVYRTSRPQRIWVAPWRDAEGVLHSGEYLYYDLPGQYTSSHLNGPRLAQDAFAPLTPGSLGFERTAPAGVPQDAFPDPANVPKKDGTYWFRSTPP